MIYLLLKQIKYQKCHFYSVITLENDLVFVKIFNILDIFLINALLIIADDEKTVLSPFLDGNPKRG